MTRVWTDGQEQFIRLVWACKPEAFDALKAAHDRDRAARWERTPARHEAQVAGAEAWRGEYKELIAAAEGCCGELHLDAPWCAQTMVNLLVRDDVVHLPDPFFFQHPAWTSRVTPFAVWERAADAAYARTKRAYASRMMKSQRSANEKHLRWLYEFQVEVRQYSEIAKDAGVHKQAVQKEVPSLAARIGLPIRKARRGRPPPIKTTE